MECLLHMLPTSSRADVVDVRRADAVLRGDLRYGLATPSHGPNRGYVVFTERGHSVSRSASMPIPGNGILGVFLRRPLSEVCRVAARWVVAGVKNVSFNLTPKCGGQGEPVGEYAISVPLETRVPTNMPHGSSPLPAGVVALGFVEHGREPSLKVLAALIVTALELCGNALLPAVPAVVLCGYVGSLSASTTTESASCVAHVTSIYARRTYTDKS